MVDPGPLDFSAWVADEDGIASVTLVSETGRELAPLAPEGGRSPSNPCWTRRSAASGRPEPAVAMGRVYRARFDTNSLPPGLYRLGVRATDNSGL